MSQLDKFMWFNNIFMTLMVFMWVFALVNEYFITGHYTKMRFLYFENVWKVFEGYWALRGMEVYKYLVKTKEKKLKAYIIEGNEALDASFLF